MSQVLQCAQFWKLNCSFDPPSAHIGTAGATVTGPKGASRTGPAGALTQTVNLVVTQSGASATALPAAAELGVALTTARSHLQHVFDKTGARNQVALAQMLAALGALPAGRGGA